MIWLSPTALTTYETCPRMYYYKYIEGWRPEKQSANLPVGTTIHAVFETHLRSIISGEPADLQKVYSESFTAQVEEQFKAGCIKLNQTWTIEDLRNMGEAITALIPRAWKATKLRPLVAASGEPMIEYTLKAPLADGVMLNARLDTVAVNDDGEAEVADFKTTAHATTDVVTSGSDQLAMQQYLVTGNAGKLAVPPPVALSFIEIVKRKVPKVTKTGKVQGQGPEIQPPLRVPAHSPELMREFLEKWRFDAAQIERGWFPKRPLMAWNSPCNNCEYARLCMFGDPTGMVRKPRSN